MTSVGTLRTGGVAGPSLFLGFVASFVAFGLIGRCVSSRLPPTGCGSSASAATSA